MDSSVGHQWRPSSSGLQTYRRKINVTDHFHYVRNLVGRDNTSPLALSTDLCRHTIFVRLENSGLVKAYGRRVNVHIAENDVGIRYPSWQPELGW
jgi:hypothetical protein